MRKYFIIFILFFYPAFAAAEGKFGFTIGLDYFPFDNGLMNAMKEALSADGEKTRDKMISNGYDPDKLKYTSPALANWAFDLAFTYIPDKEQGWLVRYSGEYSGTFWSVDYSGTLVKEHHAVEIGNFFSDLDGGYEFSLNDKIFLDFGAGLSHCFISIKQNEAYSENIFHLFSISGSSENRMANMLGGNIFIEIGFKIMQKPDLRISFKGEYKYLHDVTSPLYWAIGSIGTYLSIYTE